MNWRLLLALFGLAGVAAGGWYSHQFLEAHAIVIWAGNEWHIKAESWSLLLTIWPAVLFLSLCVSMAFILIWSFLYEKAHDIDENEAVIRIEDQAEKQVQHYKSAIQRAENERDQAYILEKSAYDIARNELDTHWHEVKKKQGQLAQEEKEIRQRNQQANRLINEAMEQVEKANAERDKAIAEQQRLQRKSHHASAAFQRQKRKAQKQEKK